MMPRDSKGFSPALCGWCVDSGEMGNVLYSCGADAARIATELFGMLLTSQ